MRNGPFAPTNSFTTGLMMRPVTCCNARVMPQQKLTSRAYTNTSLSTDQPHRTFSLQLATSALTCHKLSLQAVSQQQHGIKNIGGNLREPAKASNNKQRPLSMWRNAIVSALSVGPHYTLMRVASAHGFRSTHLILAHPDLLERRIQYSRLRLVHGVDS